MVFGGPPLAKRATDRASVSRRDACEEEESDC